MINLGSPYTKAEIHAAFTAETGAVADYFQAIPPEQFFAAPEKVWTPADNLVHLIKSVSPIVLALSLPKTALRLRFGKAKHASHPLAKIRADYKVFDDAGQAITTADYEPQVKAATAEEREKIFAKWESKNQQLLTKLEGWSEKNLDFYQLPHPLLGDRTIREMLFFTLYHNMHHVNDVQRLFGNDQVEWFAP